MTTPRQEAEQELAYVVGKDRASQLLDAYRAQISDEVRPLVLREGAALIDLWHGQAPDVYAPADSAALLRHVADGGEPQATRYPGCSAVEELL